MAVDILLGLQWGDEGKGKIVDILSPNYDYVARFQGGPNAGHTIVIGGQKIILHSLPSGVIHPHTQNIIGSGMVIDPGVLLKEVEQVKKHNIHPEDRLHLSYQASLILPTHKLIDAAHEGNQEMTKIGSTLKGIGPTYTDRAARTGIRIGDILRSDFKERVMKLVKMHKKNLHAHQYPIDQQALDEALSAFFEDAQALKQFQISHTELLLKEANDRDQQILAEGAQGSLLDLSFGTNPYVTSSNTIAAAAFTGLGLAPRKIENIYGVFKAYTTRVGEGPFPTELNNATGEAIRKAGHEFGSTTGRPRRCGWLDLNALKYAIDLNGINNLILTKVDVLDELAELKACTAYECGGQKVPLPEMNFSEKSLHTELKSFPGWMSKTSDIQDQDDLPANLQSYIDYIEKFCGTPIKMVSTGPDRQQLIWR